jgi:hypothetical protein
MSRLILLVLALGLAVWGASVVRSLLQAIPARRRTRADYFVAAVPLMTDVRQRIEPTGFARLAGTSHGLRFDLQALPDTLTFRKLPALWVMVTLTEPQDLPGETHIMARANGQESFSRFGQMPVPVALPPGFPPDCALRCDHIDGLPPADLLARVAPLFTDPRLKEAVLSPQGLRLVVLAEEAERTPYLIFRDAELGATPFPAARLHPMLTALAELHTPQRAKA